MRHLPTKPYKGLTIVLSNPSRFDLAASPKPHLLSGAAGNFVKYECLKGYCEEEECDIRTADTRDQGLLENTQGLLLFGERAFKEWSGRYYSDYTLQEQRGCPLVNGNYNGIPTICSFFPQDCMDIQDYESRFNPESSSFGGSGEGVEKEDDAEDTKRRGGATARSNYRFWLKKDTRKLLARIFPEKARKGSIEEIALNNKLPYESNIIVYPSSEEVIQILLKARNKIFFLDIETDYPLPQLSCFAFSFFDSPFVYVIPIHRWNFERAYGDVSKILWALSLCLSRNTIVVHNSHYDLLILAWKYRLLFSRRLYDTMLAQHRCFVDIERSLGHCISLWTWEPYHKDEGIFQPRNVQQERKLWEYNGKDVVTMKLVYNGQQTYANTIPGLVSSINTNNSSIYSYLLNTLFGIRFSQLEMDNMFRENDKKIIQYIRLLTLLLGKNLCEQIKRDSKTHILGSPKQCVRYYHEMLGYPVVGRTPDKQPSLKADNLYKLKLKAPNNPTIDILLKLRERIKESGSLKFEPWMKEKETASI